MSEKSELYNVASMREVFLPYILYGMGFLILTIIAFYFSSSIPAYLQKNDHLISQKPWLLYTGYGFFSLTGIFTAMILKHALFCVYKIFQSEKNMKKLREKDLIQGEKWSSIHLYCAIFVFGMGVGTIGYYILVNWQ